MKRFWALVIALTVIMSTLLCVDAGAVYNDYLENDLYSDCAIMICTDNDETIFAKNPNKQTKPASLTKIVTATIVLNNCKDLEEVYTVPESCITELQGTGSSLSGLKAGEQLTIHDLLRCLLIQSANDAATTLASYVTGSDRQAFVDKMNELAEELGCKNSHFVNVHGLDDEDQYVTASDMAVFLENAMQIPAFAEIVCMTKYTLPETNMQAEREIATTNFTLEPGYDEYYCEYSTGGKTGNTAGAGHCLASAATNDGYNYIAVALNAPKEDFDSDGYDENGAFIDVKTMYDWAFDNLRLVPIVSSTKIVGEVPVKYGKTADYVTLCPSENAFGLMPKGIDESSLLILIEADSAPEYVKAPISKGDYVCKGQVLYANDVVAEIDLVASTDVKRSFGSFFGTVAEDIFASNAFKAVAVAVVAMLAFLIYMGYRAKKKSKSSLKPKDYNDFTKK